ncbi:nucleoside hydrolase [Caldicellulosiruptoraceae bacterium PP1]
MNKKKILLDTDIGGDIDDAFCLAYLLANPECELLGITTVSGEAEKRAMMASALCYASGKDIPIYPGIEEPLFTEQKQAIAHQAIRLNNWEYKDKFEKGYAIEFLRKIIRENPNEITLLGIGPLTNIAVLFMVDPEIPSLLKELVLMAGYFDNENNIKENNWNVLCDPYAAYKVYSADVKLLKSVSFDVTQKVKMNLSEIDKKISDINSSKSDILKVVLDFASVESNHEVTFHDPLTAVTIFNNNVCTFAKGRVTISLKDESFSDTLWEPDNLGTHELALTVDSQLFFNEYFSVFNI